MPLKLWRNVQPRPVSLILFGILNIGYGLFNLLSLLFLQVVENVSKSNSTSALAKALQTDPSQLHLMWVTGVIGAVAGLVLVAAGVGLLLRKNWGRVTSLAWAAFDILMVLVTLPLSWKAALSSSPSQLGQGFAFVVTAFGLVVSLAYPLALVIFMRRPRLIEACKG
jgi:hypothetical protein